MKISRKCKSCKQEIVYLITKDDWFIPVDIDSLSFTDMQLIKLGRRVTFRINDHRTHYSTCPVAKKLRKSYI
jgi:hypothetical protein